MWGLPDKLSYIRPVKTAFYLCEYVTISKTVDIVLQPID